MDHKRAFLSLTSQCLESTQKNLKAIFFKKIPFSMQFSFGTFNTFANLT